MTEVSAQWTPQERINVTRALLKVVMAANSFELPKLAERCLYRAKRVLNDEARTLEINRPDILFYARLTELPSFPCLPRRYDNDGPPPDRTIWLTGADPERADQLVACLRGLGCAGGQTSVAVVSAPGNTSRVAVFSQLDVPTSEAYAEALRLCGGTVVCEQDPSHG